MNKTRKRKSIIYSHIRGKKFLQNKNLFILLKKGREPRGFAVYWRAIPVARIVLFGTLSKLL